jgi:hypothetical protein
MVKRRNQNYIDREVQSSLLRRMCGQWLMFFVANVLALVAWTITTEPPANSQYETIQLVAQRLAPFLLVSVALAPVFFWDTLKLTNRFAGPIVRVRRALLQIAEGKSPGELEFRSGDFWRCLANDLNRAFLYRNANLEKVTHNREAE